MSLKMAKTQICPKRKTILVWWQKNKERKLSWTKKKKKEHGGTQIRCPCTWSNPIKLFVKNKLKL